MRFFVKEKTGRSFDEGGAMKKKKRKTITR